MLKSTDQYCPLSPGPFSLPHPRASGNFTPTSEERVWIAERLATRDVPFDFVVSFVSIIPVHCLLSQFGLPSQRVQDLTQVPNNFIQTAPAYLPGQAVGNETACPPLTLSPQTLSFLEMLQLPVRWLPQGTYIFWLLSFLKFLVCLY